MQRSETYAPWTKRVECTLSPGFRRAFAGSSRACARFVGTATVEVLAALIDECVDPSLVKASLQAPPLPLVPSLVLHCDAGTCNVPILAAVGCLFVRRRTARLRGAPTALETMIATTRQATMPRRATCSACAVADCYVHT
jgi:hypothetical protein